MSESAESEVVVADLGLSTPVSSALEAAGIIYMSQLRMRIRLMQPIRNIGPIGWREVEDALKACENGNGSLTSRRPYQCEAGRAPDPSQEDIRAQCAEIQETWDDNKRTRSIVGCGNQWEVPVIPMNTGGRQK